MWNVISWQQVKMEQKSISKSARFVTSFPSWHSYESPANPQSVTFKSRSAKLQRPLLVQRKMKLGTQHATGKLLMAGLCRTFLSTFEGKKTQLKILSGNLTNWWLFNINIDIDFLFQFIPPPSKTYWTPVSMPHFWNFNVAWTSGGGTTEGETCSVQHLQFF